MKTKTTAAALFFLISAGLLALGGCRFGGEEATPTAGLNPTQSYETAVARVTEFFLETQTAAGGQPTASAPPGTATPTETPGTPLPTATSAPPTAQPTSTAQPCDKAAPGSPIDVTIPDDTIMLPGLEFVKTWRLVNAGTCTWTNQYAVVWVSGEEIGNQNTVFLNGSVAPGQSVDISVPMTAPDEPGSYQSNWKLRNAAGLLFGIGDAGESVFWVRIQVALATSTPTPTVTTTPSATQTPTASPTPVVFASGSVNLALGDTADLDSLGVNPGGGVDLAYALDPGNNHLLSPQNGARIGFYGGSAPGFSQCQAASLGTAPLAVESVGVGSFLCFQTDSGRYGQFQLTGFDNNTGALTIAVTTWETP